MKRKFLAVLSGLTLLIFGTLMAAPANATQDYTWVSWKIPAGTVHGTPHNAGDVGWPQQLVDIGQQTPPCGVWYQVDKYRGAAHTLDWLFADGLLTINNGQPEDHAIVVDWYFVYGGDCADYSKTSTDKSGVSECTVPTNGTAVVTTTTTLTTTTYKWIKETNTFEAQEPVITTTTSTKTVKDAGCTIKHAPKPHPVHHTVNFTG